jgi:CubicO group peptidase (beta-lactamase class C family)
MKTSYQLFILCTLTFISVVLNGQQKTNENPYAPLLKEIKEVIPKKMDKYNVAGLSMALIDGDKIVWAKGFGYQNTKKNIPASPYTNYSIGAITKLFTATAILQLQEQNKILIDQPLKVYLKDFDIKSDFGSIDSIRIKNMLYHHSGLPSDLTIGTLQMSDDFTSILPQLKNRYTKSPPNYRFSYSNIDYILLGHLIQEVSDSPYEKYIQKNIFKAIGMNNTGFIGNKKLINQSQSYSLTKPLPPPPFSLGTPVMAINSNVMDLAKLLVAFNNDGILDGKRILSKQSVQQMFRVQNKNSPLDLDKQYGLSWSIHPSDNYGNFYYQDGSVNFFHSIVIIHPEQKLGVIMLTNSQFGYYLTDYVHQIIRKMCRLKNKSIQIKETSFSARPVSLSKDALQKYEGLYVMPGWLIRLKLKNNQLIAQFPQGKHTPLCPISENRFHLDCDNDSKAATDPCNTLIINKINNEQLLSFGSENCSKLIGQKVTPYKIPKSWRSALGKYKKTDKNIHFVAKHITLKEKDGFLILQYKNKYYNTQNGYLESSFVLKPLTNNRAIILGLGRYAGESCIINKRPKGININFLGLNFYKAGF